MTRSGRLHALKTSDKIVPWGVSEFAEKGVSHEIFDYLEHTASSQSVAGSGHAVSTSASYRLR